MVSFFSYIVLTMVSLPPSPPPLTVMLLPPRPDDFPITCVGTFFPYLNVPFLTPYSRPYIPLPSYVSFVSPTISPFYLSPPILSFLGKHPFAPSPLSPLFVLCISKTSPTKCVECHYLISLLPRYTHFYFAKVTKIFPTSLSPLLLFAVPL